MVGPMLCQGKDKNRMIVFLFSAQRLPIFVNACVRQVYNSL